MALNPAETPAAIDVMRGGGFLAGYRKTGLDGGILQWAMVISLDIILALFSLFVLFVVQRLPVRGSVVPAVRFSTGLSFRRKLLLSFLDQLSDVGEDLRMGQDQLLEGRCRELEGQGPAGNANRCHGALSLEKRHLAR